MAYTTIDDPSAHFQIATYNGDSNNSTVITNDGIVICNQTGFGLKAEMKVMLELVVICCLILQEESKALLVLIPHF